MPDFVNVPISKDKDSIQYMQVQFKFDNPGESVKPDFTSYYWGCYVQDDNGNFTIEKSLGFYDSLRKVLFNLDNVPDNADHRGKKIKAYRPTKGTIVELGCLQERPGDSKSNKYEAYHIGGPVLEVSAAQSDEPKPTPTNQPPQQKPASSNESQPKLTQPKENKLMNGRIDNSYHPMTDGQKIVAASQISDLGGTLRMAWDYIQTNFQDVEEEENRRAMAIHLNMEIAFHNRKYSGLYEEPGPNATPSANGNGGGNDVDLTPPTGANETVWNELVEAGALGDKGKIVSAFFETLVNNTPTKNDFSCKAALKLMGISNVPAGPAAKYDAYEKLLRYYWYRGQKHEPDAAAAAVVAEYEDSSAF